MSLVHEFYAVGISKGWVEIRSSLTPPKPRKSQVLKEVEVKIPARMVFCISPDGKHMYKRRPEVVEKHPLKIQACTFNGGKVVRSYAFTKFFAKTGLFVNFGEMRKLTPKLAQKLRLLS